MARASQSFTCTACGATASKWAGRCDSCGEWNSLVEDLPGDGPAPVLQLKKKQAITLSSLATEEAEAPRIISGIAEFDRVCGGGLVPGSALLVGGDPGIGKSTLLLQATAALAARGVRAIYISGEESGAQVKLRAKRLGLAGAPVELGIETRLGNILATVEKPTKQPPGILVIDSIQTVMADAIDAAPGTVSQLRGTTQELVRFAKRSGWTVILVGHVTKEGQIAGPRVIEHMVDTVLYFEGDRGHRFRILRGVKNRFGPTDEIGVFDMTGNGLEEVANPSALFLAGRRDNSSGSVVFAGMEGSRPVLVEIQALVAPTSLGTPRRTVVGWDSGRLAMVLAVLDTRCNLSLSSCDVYLNVAGGLRIYEPAADLAVATALISSYCNVAARFDSAVFGEISLSGEVRTVAQSDKRLKEAAKLGLTHAIVPAGTNTVTRTMSLQQVEMLNDLVDSFLVQADGHTAQSQEARSPHENDNR